MHLLIIYLCWASAAPAPASMPVTTRTRVAIVDRAVDLHDPVLAAFVDVDRLARIAWSSGFGPRTDVAEVHARYLAREPGESPGTAVARAMLKGHSAARVELVPLPDVPPPVLNAREYARLAYLITIGERAAIERYGRALADRVNELTTIFTRENIRVVNLAVIPRVSHSVWRTRPFVRAYLSTFANFVTELARRNPNVVFTTAARGGTLEYARLALPNVIVAGPNDAHAPVLAKYVIHILLRDPGLRGPELKIKFMEFLRGDRADRTSRTCDADLRS